MNNALQSKPQTDTQTNPLSNSHKLSSSEHQMKTWDGESLFYRAWHPGHVRNKAVILFHGGHEHSGRFEELVNSLNLEDASVFAWDARGHGRSPGQRGYANHFHDLVRDADTFIHHISDTYDIAIEDMVVLGHSVGSVIISTWLHDYAPAVRGAVLGSPAFHVKLYAPFAVPALKLWQKIKPYAFVNSYVKPGMLTHDKKEAEARRHDSLISPEIAVRVLTSLFDTADRVIQGAASIQTPTLLLCAGNDWVVKRSAQTQFFNQLGSQDKHMHVFPGFYHEVFHEQDRQQPINMAKAFIEKQLSNPASSKSDICDSNISDSTIVKQGLAATESLSQALPASSLRSIGFKLTRFTLNSIGRLSTGIRLGWKTGFDSGTTLDYIYRNQAKGITSLGRLIDRTYLNSVGWIGIRQRREHMQEALGNILRRAMMKGEKVHIMDIASGPARYLLSTIKISNYDKISATCRDWDEIGLQEGRQLSQSLNLDCVNFERADAFSLESYAQLETAPNIVIASGLYELFSDNEKIKTSLQGIYNAMPENGTLIYTNQPHHPQLEMIARTLVNRDQQPWVMRLRSQTEMNQLVRQAGFTPVSSRIDDYGIFTVNVAVKLPQL